MLLFAVIAFVFGTQPVFASEETEITSTSDLTTGWYHIKYTSSDYAGRYIHNRETEYRQNASNSYPLFVQETPSTPAADDPTYFVYIERNGTNYRVRSANGHYMNANAAASVSPVNISIAHDDSGFQFASYWCYFPTLEHIWGKASAASGARYAISRVDFDDLLDTWAVNISNATVAGEVINNPRVTCTNTALKGIGTVYNGGTFFFAKGTEPAAADFSLVGTTGAWEFTVDATAHTITAEPTFESTIEEGFAYHVVNANGRGELYSCPSKSSMFVWSTGVTNAPETAEAHHQWVFIPTGEENTYYIYNVGRQRYIEPFAAGTYHTLKGGQTWMFTPNKIAIKVTPLGNKQFSIRTADTDTYLSISNTFEGPVIDYYSPTDPGVAFNLNGKIAITDAIRQQMEKASAGLMLSEVTVKQGFQTTGRGNKRDVLLCVGMMGFNNADVHPTKFSVALSNTTLLNIDALEVYQTSNPEFYAVKNPTKLCEVSELSSNNVDLPLSDYKLVPGTNYLWITAKVKEEATIGQAIDASLRQIVYTDNGEERTLYVSSIGNPSGAAKIFATQSFAYVPTTDNCRFYRIPAMILDKEGNIVIAMDRRYNSNADLGGHKIDVSVRRSEDGGHTWSAQKIIAAGDGSTQANYGYGDAALARTQSGRLICVMAAGSVMYWNGMKWAAICTSDDNGLTWTSPRQLYTSNFTDLVNNKTNQLGFYGNFVSSGKGLTTFDGTVMFTTNCLTNDDHGTPQCYILASKDNGENWTLGPENAYTACDESKLEQLNDGRLIVSVRQSGNRGFNIGNADATGWGEKWRTGSISGNACNADILVHSRSAEDGANVMLHSYIKSGSRQNLTLSRSLDEGQTWTDLMNIQPGGSAYSTMIKLPNGDVAILFEDEAFSVGNGYAQTFVVVTKEQILKDVPLGIENMELPVQSKQGEAVYTINGQRIPSPQRGLNIIRKADGTVRKVLVK
ncbi:MAG: exo-alpha-sialidase [Prevotella sp.]|nr:exo-alpha-sialidase [Prevotella sp.]